MDLYAIMFQEILFFFLEAKCITMSCESKMKLKFEISTRYQMQIDTEPNNIIHTAHTREPQWNYVDYKAETYNEILLLNENNNAYDVYTYGSG